MHFYNLIVNITELAQPVDVMMAWASTNYGVDKKNVILMLEMNIWLSFLFVLLWCFPKETENIFSFCFSWVTEMLVKVWENSKKALSQWKHLPAASVPTALLDLPNSYMYI